MQPIQYLLPAVRTTLFSALLVGATTSFAQLQQQPSAAELIATAHEPLATFAPVHAKATQSAGRLIATSAYNAAGTVLAPSDSAQYFYTGDINALPDRLVSYRSNGGVWYIYSHFLYAYDGSGRNATTEYELWSPASLSYVKAGRYTYTYNAAGAKTSMIYELWNRITSAYGNGLRETYTLDAANNMTDFLQEIWDPSKTAYNNNQHISQTFNAQAGVTDYVLQLWDGINSKWINKKHIASSYDASGLHIQLQATEVWDLANYCWQPSQKTVSTYNASSLLSLATTDLYSLQDSLYHPYQKDAYTYNTVNNVATHLISNWDTTAQKYINSTNATYSYNSNAQNTLIATRTWVSGSWAIGAGSRDARNYYEDNNSSLGTASAAPQLAFRAVPNPAVSTLRISLAAAGNGQAPDAVLMDLRGLVLRHFALTTTNGLQEGTVNVENLPAGNYLLQVSGSSTASRQLITVRH